MTAILYGLSVLILSCAVAWLLRRLRNGRPRCRPRLSRQEMRALRRIGPNLRALENWAPDQRVARAIRRGVLTLSQALRLDGMQEARLAARQQTGQPNGTGLPKSGRISGL